MSKEIIDLIKLFLRSAEGRALIVEAVNEHVAQQNGKIGS